MEFDDDVNELERSDLRLARDDSGKTRANFNFEQHAPQKREEEFTRYLDGLKDSAERHERAGDQKSSMRYNHQALLEQDAFTAKTFADFAAAAEEGRPEHSNASSREADWSSTESYEEGDVFEVHSKPKMEHGRPNSSLYPGDSFTVLEVDKEKNTILVNKDGNDISLRPSVIGHQIRHAGNAKHLESTKARSPVEQDLSTSKSDETESKLSSGNPNVDTSLRPYEVKGFKAEVKDQAVEYSKDGYSKPAFVDHGKHIKLADSKEADAIRGSMELASKKFKKIKLSGTEEFKKQACMEAVRMGVGDRIVNAEMRDYIKSQQDAMKDGEQKSRSISQHQGMAKKELESMAQTVKATSSKNHSRAKTATKSSGRKQQKKQEDAQGQCY